MGNKTQEEWKELAAEYTRSEMQQKEWCEGKGINLFTFRDRLSRLRKLENRELPKLSKRCPNEKEVSKINTSGTSWLELELELKPHESTPRDRAMAEKKEAASVIEEPLVAKEDQEFQVRIGSFIIIIPQMFEETNLTRICKALKSL